MVLGYEIGLWGMRWPLRALLVVIASIILRVASSEGAFGESTALSTRGYFETFAALITIRQEISNTTTPRARSGKCQRHRRIYRLMKGLVSDIYHFNRYNVTRSVAWKDISMGRRLEF